MAATISCPICRRKVPFEGPNMPFCSDRCRLVDLANWATDKYVISTPADLSELEDMESEQ